MKLKFLLLMLAGLILALLLHIFFNGFTSNVASEGFGHGLLPTEHYADLSDFIFKAIRSIFLYVLTLFGIFFNIIWTESGKDKIKNFWTLSTLRPLLISPIVFYSVYLFATKEPDTVVALLFSFQSGFFWQSVLTKKKIETKEDDKK